MFPKNTRGAPWHCGFPMRPSGGYQCGGPNEWVAWRCESCPHRETSFGHMHRSADGADWFEPTARKILTVLMYQTPEGVLCRGISEDITIFDNLLYADTKCAVDGIGRHYAERGYRCVFDLPKEKSC